MRKKKDKRLTIEQQRDLLQARHAWDEAGHRWIESSPDDPRYEVLAAHLDDAYLTWLNHWGFDSLFSATTMIVLCPPNRWAPILVRLTEEDDESWTGTVIDHVDGIALRWSKDHFRLVHGAWLQTAVGD